jgi:hypothetical protein
MLDIGNDPIPLPGHHLVGEPQRPISSLGKPGVPLSILLGFMKWAVELDDQPDGMTAEVGDEPAHRELTTEM